jgi:hypothetical protein
MDDLYLCGKPFLLDPPRQHFQGRLVDVQADDQSAAQAGQFQRRSTLAAAYVEDSGVIQLGQHLECFPGEVEAGRACFA